jgi:hypothetical protein
VTENDNHKPDSDPPFVLDVQRGHMAQKATDERRQQSAVRADQEAIKDNQDRLEKTLFAGPAETWPQAVEKATYLLRLFALTPDAQDPRYKRMIATALEDLQRFPVDSPSR